LRPFAPTFRASPTPIQHQERDDFVNKTNPGVALVTGASSGIGRATAKAWQSAGFRVFGTSRRAAVESSDGVTMLASSRLQLCARWHEWSRAESDRNRRYPEVVARTILEAATASAPRRRYAAGIIARKVSFPRRFVPESAFNKACESRSGCRSEVDIRSTRQETSASATTIQRQGRGTIVIRRADAVVTPS
jgi:hypothetical protein